MKTKEKEKMRKEGKGEKRKRELIIRRGKSKWGEEVEKKVGKEKNWPCWVSNYSNSKT